MLVFQAAPPKARENEAECRTCQNAGHLQREEVKGMKHSHQPAANARLLNIS
jgi:hypothetical protein